MPEQCQPHPVPAPAGVPFDSAEEAWFWAVVCRRARAEGAQVTSGLALVPRICEPDDILIAAERLLRRGELGPAHKAVLIRSAADLLPPERGPRGDDHAVRHWNEAMDRLAEALAAKGILA